MTGPKLISSNLQKAADLIKEYPDFPKEGILFRDIFPIFLDPKASQSLVTETVNCINQLMQMEGHLSSRVDAIVGLDARGFLIGPPVAVALGCKFIPIRKKGKLPGPVYLIESVKEYGKDELEIQQGAIESGDRVVVLDDLLATGGTAKAAGDLVVKCGGVLAAFLFCVELSELQGRQKLGSDIPTLSLITY